MLRNTSKVKWILFDQTKSITQERYDLFVVNHFHQYQFPSVFVNHQKCFNDEVCFLKYTTCWKGLLDWKWKLLIALSLNMITVTLL